MQKKKTDRDGIVYSTNPEFRIEDEAAEHQAALPPAAQRFTVSLDKKQRAGKAVTLVEGWVGPDDGLEELGKKLKTICGTGGSVKDGIIIIQGDNREKIRQWLGKNGYGAVRVR